MVYFCMFLYLLGYFEGRVVQIVFDHYALSNAKQALYNFISASVVGLIIVTFCPYFVNI